MRGESDRRDTPNFTSERDVWIRSLESSDMAPIKLSEIQIFASRARVLDPDEQ